MGEFQTGELQLDVFTPLRSAREHAVKSLVGWLIAFGVVSTIALSEPRLFGWAVIDHRIEGRVVDIEPRDDEDLVTFEGHGDGRVMRWQRWVDRDHEWDVGDRETGWVSEDGRFYSDYGITWVESADYPFFLFLSGCFVVFSARRLLGLLVAHWDLGRSGDLPRLAFVALIFNPAPRAWRPLLLIWRDDPTKAEELPSPDEVFLADDETGQDLVGGTIREAWVDVGRYWWMKPRWVGVEGGVIIPHRRALLTGLFARRYAAKQGITGPVPMTHTAPVTMHGPGIPEHRHNFSIMLVGRLVGVVLFALFSGFVISGDEIVNLMG